MFSVGIKINFGITSRSSETDLHKMRKVRLAKKKDLNVESL